MVAMLGRRWEKAEALLEVHYVAYIHVICLSASLSGERIVGSAKEGLVSACF